MSRRALFLGFASSLLLVACATGDTRDGTLTGDPSVPAAPSSGNAATTETTDEGPEQPCEEDGHAVAGGDLDGRLFGERVAPIAGKATYEASYYSDAMVHFAALDAPEACWADSYSRKRYLAFDIPTGQVVVGKQFSGVPVTLKGGGLSEKSTTCSRVEIVSSAGDALKVRLRVQDTHGAVVEGELDYPMCEAKQ